MKAESWQQQRSKGMELMTLIGPSSGTEKLLREIRVQLLEKQLGASGRVDGVAPHEGRDVTPEAHRLGPCCDRRYGGFALVGSVLESSPRAQSRCRNGRRNAWDIVIL
jgi:hypothetical protein